MQCSLYLKLHDICFAKVDQASSKFVKTVLFVNAPLVFPTVIRLANKGFSFEI